MDKILKVNFVPFSNFGDTSVPYMLKKLNIPFVFAHHTISGFSINIDIDKLWEKGRG